MQHMQVTPQQADRNVLTASRWIATPSDYASSQWFRLMPDGSGEAVFGYGQTVYAKTLLAFDVPAAGTLVITHLLSPAFGHVPAFDPADVAARPIQYTLEATTYAGKVSVTGRPFACQWLLVLNKSPWPEEMKFPRPIPLEFYGGIEYARYPWRGPGAA